MKQLGWTILGAFLGLIVYIAYEHLITLRRPREIYGTWCAMFQPSIETGWDWVTDNIVISRRWGKIIIQNFDNSIGYRWEGRARIYKDRFLLGEWKSKKPGSHSGGIFALTLGFEGNYMCGYFIAPDTDSSKIGSGFVLGRTKADVITAKKRLESARIVFPRECTKNTR
jgi:hypothetical protein